ncbi:uncharacterized protein BJ212DRAFT_1457401 [Suillus subaureus]|uniref:DUF6533 domain-containing protein n=1 Tax=Suillus subaureus TaxID=48587 RepID=A0A9P7JH97_9AGAM|nr:uncharacterized protein BJ212DRAFT_1457401 [Suillus subaureus]KAG1821981.1 hypothetical protein BJ212DRAFT_1457401 [Suillus subaureus]
MTIDHAIHDLGLSPGIVFVTIASFTVLCWDHIITFADEVALIWCKPKGFREYRSPSDIFVRSLHYEFILVGCLFLLVREPASDVSENKIYFKFKNRYITPLGFVVNIVALTLPTWSTESCRNFVRYEGAMAIIGVSVAQLIMLSRIHVLYPGNRVAITIPGLLFLVWVALEAYAMACGESEHTCYMCRRYLSITHNIRILSAARAWMPLTYDSALFAMILWRTLPTVWSKGAGRILPKLLIDGTLYYTVICSANLVLTVMILRAPPGQKGIAAQLVYLLTVVMTSRATLRLKKQMCPTVTCTSSDQHRHYSMHSPTLSKSAASLVPWQTPNMRLQSQCLPVVSCAPVPSIPIDTDDTQSLEDGLPIYADVESQ